MAAPAVTYKSSNSLGSWDIVGIGTGKFYGNLNNPDLVLKVVGGGVSEPSASEMFEKLQAIYTTKLTNNVQYIKSCIEQWKEDGQWGQVIRDNTAFMINSYATAFGFRETVILTGGAVMNFAECVTYITGRIKNALRDAGIDPDDPQPIKPTLPEESLEHVPPDEVDTAAVELLTNLEGSLSNPVGTEILLRAVAYLENIEESLDCFRLHNPGTSTVDFKGDDIPAPVTLEEEVDDPEPEEEEEEPEPEPDYDEPDYDEDDNGEGQDE